MHTMHEIICLHCTAGTGIYWETRQGSLIEKADVKPSFISLCEAHSRKIVSQTCACSKTAS